MDEATKQKVREVINRIIGVDETPAHDRMTSMCTCHQPEQLYSYVNPRNLLRRDQRTQVEVELSSL